MVTERSGVTFAKLQKSVFPRIMERFGRNDIVLTRQTLTYDSNKQITGITETTQTIEGDLQFVTYDDRQYVDMGIANVGDGIFFCIHDTTLSACNRVTVDGVSWELVSQVEAETIDTERIFQGWITRKRP